MSLAVLLFSTAHKPSPLLLEHILCARSQYILLCPLALEVSPAMYMLPLNPLLEPSSSFVSSAFPLPHSIAFNPTMLLRYCFACLYRMSITVALFVQRSKCLCFITDILYLSWKEMSNKKVYIMRNAISCTLQPPSSTASYRFLFSNCRYC